jgi:CheY-like chemotaxis protein
MDTDIRVVYIEDNFWNRKVVELLIIHLLIGAQFAIFEDSANLIDKLNSLPWKPNIILADIRMTPYNGYEVLAMLRAHNDYTSVKIIAVTAGLTDEESESLERAGFDGVMAKPINADNFSNFVMQALSGHKAWNII